MANIFSKNVYILKTLEKKKEEESETAHDSATQ